MGERIALGLGDNVDYEIKWNSSVYEELIECYDIRESELVIGKPIESERDLAVSVLAYLKSGRGGEEWIAANDVIDGFAQRFINKITLGGSSVRAAIAMHRMGYSSALHLVTINQHVRKLIPRDNPYICSNSEDTLYPHLIVQFDTGTTVQTGDVHVVAQRPNRIIYHNDVDNINMAINEDFADLCRDAEVFLVSGFNAMHDEALLRDRLASLKRILAQLPDDTTVFYEDAAFYNQSFTHIVFDELADWLDIVSLNEDELQVYLNRSVNMLDAEDVVRALTQLREIVPAPIIVLHTMYWALAFGENAAAYEQALRGGTTMASSRYVYGDDFTPEEYEDMLTSEPNERGKAVTDALQQTGRDDICSVTVVHRECAAPTTVGLGDAFVGGFLPALLA